MSVIPKTSDQVDQWRSVMFLYDSALKKLNTKIEILNNEFVNRYDHNPIEHIKSRLSSSSAASDVYKRQPVSALSVLLLLIFTRLQK